MPINDDKQITLKALENQCLFLFKELQQYLPKQLYRQAIVKCEKLINKNYMQLSQVCASILLKILFLQTKAVLKILQKNIYKKYFYQQNIVNKLMKILNRNNSICNAILITKIKSKEILEDQLSKLNTYDGFSQCNLFKNDISKQNFQIMVKNFCEIYLSSVTYQYANFKKYKLSLQKWKNFVQYFENLSQNMPNFSFKTQFSVVSIKLALCKVLFEKNQNLICLKLINRVIEKLLNLHFKIRLWYENKQKTQLQIKEKQKNLKKKKHYVKKVLKLLTISIIMMIRVNMKSRFEDLAIQGIKIFNFIHQKSVQNQMGHFRKYLNPQIYIYQQFCQYKAQKFQIQQVIKPLFVSKIQEIKTDLQSKQDLDIQSFNSEQKNADIYNFYNEKMLEFRQKLQYKEKKQLIKRTANKKLLQQNQLPKNSQTQTNNITKKARQHSIKSKRSTRIKNPFGSSFHTQTYSVASNYQKSCKNEDLLNMQQSIIDDLQKTNRAYLTSRKQSNGQFNRWENIQNAQNETQRIQNIQEKNIQININPSQIENNEKQLKVAQKLIGNFFNKTAKSNLNLNVPKQIVKNKKLVRSALIKKSDKQKSINIPAQTQKLHQIKQQMFKDLKDNIELLKQKKNNKTSLIIEYSTIDDNFFQPKNTTNQISSSYIDQKYEALHGFIVKQIESHHNSTEKRNSNNIKSSSTKNINSKYKDKLKHLNKKTKLKMFIQLLTKNKQHFGVKKWSQKIQYIKKKQQMKEKLRSTRKTTSINMSGLRSLSPKLNFIAGNVLMYSLQEIEQLNSSQKLQRRMTGSHTLNNQNNYRLGMKSIEILMNKLQKEKQTFSHNNQKLSQKTNRTTKTERNSLDKNKNMYSSVSKLNSNKNKWMCKFVL